MSALTVGLGIVAVWIWLWFLLSLAIVPPIELARKKKDKCWLLLYLVTVPATVILVCLIIRAIGA